MKRSLANALAIINGLIGPHTRNARSVCRRCLLLRVVQEKQRRIAKSLGASSDQPDTSAQALRMYSAVLRIGSMRLPKHSALSLAIIAGE